MFGITFISYLTIHQAALKFLYMMSGIDITNRIKRDTGKPLNNRCTLLITHCIRMHMHLSWNIILI